ncbi:MAG TPA: anthranilate synthase component I family protein [Chitinophagaceae bacterium]
MKRSAATFRVHDIKNFKIKMLNWCTRFNIFIFLDSNGYRDPYSKHEWILGAGAVAALEPSAQHLDALGHFTEENDDWLFGHLGYDLKNQAEILSSRHPDKVGFPDLFFFRPAIVIRFDGQRLEISSASEPPAAIHAAIETTTAAAPTSGPPLRVQQRIGKNTYLDIIRRLQEHIRLGDCYEINFCQEFFAEEAVVDPLSLYLRLSEISPNPFAGFYRLHDRYLLCASPERFLQKTGSRIISQPMKGTIRRNLADAVADEQLKAELQQSEKERSENVMVVDLVRNDLSRICTEASVEVSDLFGIYTFPQVHQMVSTVTGQLRPGVGFADIIRATFPMGSMTGAPKIRVMELIEQYEHSRRGIYSGAIGYIDPGNDFDFNVVIRSIMYNRTDKYLSYQAGGGITFYSNPEQEYEECLLKATAIKKVLE